MTAFELDHLFICTTVGAPEASRLLALGLTEGGRNVHPGQGTENRRFFFRNAMIELLWLSDEREAKSERVARTRLYERCNYRETGASPFGLCLRPSGLSGGELPFGCWEYRPPYLPENTSLCVADSSRFIDEPLLVYVPFGTRPDEYPEDRKQPLEHRAGFAELTSVRITVRKSGPYSAALSRASETGCFSVVRGEEHLMEIGFDGERRGGRSDFRPALSLIFSW